MTFDEFCELYKVKPEERKDLAIYLAALRLKALLALVVSDTR